MALKYTGERDQQWVQQLTAQAGQFSDPVIIPGFVTRIAAYVYPGIGGSATLQFTGEPEEDVVDNPGGIPWLDWDIGAVTSNKACAAFGEMTAVRLKAVAQMATARIVGHKTIRR